MKCSRCSADATPGRKLCETCRLTLYTNRKARTDEWKATGLCQWCGSDALIAGASWCPTCTCKRIASNRLKAGSRWSELLDLFNQQNGKCAYTGLPLTLGLNASIDHIVPSSKNGNHSIQNLQWVETSINRMKGNMDHAEFKAFLAVLRDSLNQLLFE